MLFILCVGVWCTRGVCERECKGENKCEGMGTWTCVEGGTGTCLGLGVKI